MPIEGVDLRNMSYQVAVGIIMRLFEVKEDAARQIWAAETGRPFHDVLEKGTITKGIKSLSDNTE